MGPELLIAAGLLSMGGTALKLWGAAQADQQADLDYRENTRLLNIAQQDALTRGRREAADARMAGTAMQGAQTAAYAKEGIGGASAALTIAGTGAAAEYAAMQAENNAAREAWGIAVKRDQMGREYQFEKKQRPLRNAATVLGGAGDLATLYGRSK